MMGSPASRGAVACVGAGRASLAAAPAVSAVNAAIAASVTIAGGPQRRGGSWPDPGAPAPARRGPLLKKNRRAGQEGGAAPFDPDPPPTPPSPNLSNARFVRGWSA